jgi:hypothetical protein
MMTRLPPFVYVLIIACIGSGFVYYGVTTGWERQPATPAQAQAMVIQATAQPTTTGTPSPIPTVDYSAVHPALTQAAAAADMAQAQDKIARAASTIAAATSIAIDNAGRVGTPTAIAMMTEQAVGTEQVRATNDAGFRAVEFAGVQATMAAKADTERRRANRDDVLFYGVVLTVAGVLLVIVWAIAYRVNLNAWRETAGDTSDNLLDNLQEPTLPAYPAGIDARLFYEFLSPRTLLKAARLVMDGVPLVHDNYTPAAKCMSEGQFTKFQYLLVSVRAAAWDDDTHKGGITLNEKGGRFFTDLITTPPLNQDVPKTTPPAVKRSIDDGFTPIGAGEGGIIDQIEYDGPVPTLPPNSQRVVKATVRKDAG